MYREHTDILDRIFKDYGLSLCVQGTFGDILKTAHSDPVYPCVYREHLLISPMLAIMSGLSLCVQGTSTPIGIVFVEVRFIPVCTGNIPIITYCFIIKILTVKFLPIFGVNLQ